MKQPRRAGKRLSRKQIIATIAVVFGLVAVSIALWQPLSDLARDPEQLKHTIQDSGAWGPLIFIGVQFLQVLVAPIPGQVAGAIAGALFGAFWGTVYSMVGALIGYTVIFLLARKFGRPLVDRFVPPKYLEKFDYLTKESGVFVFFLIFLLPAFPDDVICYIAGLSKIRIRTLILISLAGRLPGFIGLSLIGAGAADGNATLVTVLLTVSAILAALGFWQRARLEAWVKHFSRPGQ
jgi:uncharacterized membrane protein YdjX (TVP38/TMEM64 family)